MPDAYEVYEGRFIQLSTASSAVAATTISSLPVPAQKVMTILAGGYYPDAAETKIVSMNIATASGSSYPIAYPVSILLNTVSRFPVVTEGMELKLFPGEYIYVTRDSATAGSIMVLQLRFVLNDLPYYAYKDPLSPTVEVNRKHGSVYRSSGGISQGGSSSVPGGNLGQGKTGGPQPV